MIKKLPIIAATLLFYVGLGYSQNSEELTLAQTVRMDPVNQFKWTWEGAFGLGLTRVNTNHLNFQNAQGDFSLTPNNFIPRAQTSILFTRYLRPKEMQDVTLFGLKSGAIFFDPAADLTGPNGEELRLTNSTLAIPVMFLARLPINHNTLSKNGFYRAIEIGAGAYASIPFSQSLVNPDDLDNRNFDNVFARYIKFGAISEISFSSLNKDGYGYKFGVRTMSDATGIWRLSDTDNQIYPSFANVQFF
ncbi:MAG: hypothetical protein ACXITV_03385, partial [Luteibaculaceae bacterium]